VILLLLSLLVGPVAGEESVARKWNEVLLEAIRNDFARPTVHARNLFHVSVAMYDAWAAYDDVADPWLLGRTVGSYTAPFTAVEAPGDLADARKEAISYAAYGLLVHRFKNSPGAAASTARFDALMADLGYDPTFDVASPSGTPAQFGNYIALTLIGFGFVDGANETGDYGSISYQAVNPPLDPTLPGNPDILDLDHWQPLKLGTFIDQSGNTFPVEVPDALSPEWGEVVPFSLSDVDLTVHERDGVRFQVYHDPGPPPGLDPDHAGAFPDEYKWSHAFVAVWGSHLTSSDSVMWDISPGSIGNTPDLPVTFEEHRQYYNLFDGGDYGSGHDVNPATGQPYDPQLVPRGDYTRVLAEFWADGPDSETPPGHWFTILNYVNDHPMLVKRFRGKGDILDDLEWDVKSYLALGGAVHDAAIAAWGAKGYYDYVRPISAIRGMAERGQSSDPSLPRYDPDGIPLIDGYIELVREDDIFVVRDGENLNKIKLYTWRGHALIADPATSAAGVWWTLAEDWWPYQRPTFVTPPFPGYVSGHSTFSRAAAECLTLLTGDAYFPGGMGTFHAPKDEFLVFENGPSVDVTLQWATYRDASDQTSLSRIWGGIHPPADDIPGRIIGERVGIDAFHEAERFFTGRSGSRKVGDFDGNLAVDFTDFLLFAEHFNTAQGEAAWNATFDLNDDGRVGFEDFLTFAQAFGQE
jgi:hypothetical protein